MRRIVLPDACVSNITTQQAKRNNLQPTTAECIVLQLPLLDVAVFIHSKCRFCRPMCSIDEKLAYRFDC